MRKVTTRASRPSRDRLRRKRAALTLVEAALLVSFAGLVLAVAVPTFVRTVQTSKVAEATLHLDALYRSSASYYAVPHLTAEGARTYCFAEPAGPTPPTPSDEPTVVDFLAEGSKDAVVWSALAFAPREPLRYRYTYAPTIPGCSASGASAARALTLRAEGDLDADGVYSSFERRASVAAPGELSPDPVLHIRDRIE